MTAPGDVSRRRLLTAVFKMPSVQTMVSRKSSVTNAFVNSIVPVVPPTADEIDEALSILGMEPADVRCAFCGDKATEWDHLRPLVLKHRPTGFISEIANLVPACGKCNQSKGNKPWRDWMLGKAALSPTGRAVAGTPERIIRLEAYEKWRSPTRIEFEAILGAEIWEQYWRLLDDVNAELRRCHDVAVSIRSRVGAAIAHTSAPGEDRQIATTS